MSSFLLEVNIKSDRSIRFAHEGGKCLKLENVLLIADGLVRISESDLESLAKAANSSIEFFQQKLWHLDGNWSLALIHPAQQKIVLARDHFGKRPLFFRRSGDTFYVGSDITSLLKRTGRETVIHPQSVVDFLVHNSDAIAPRTFYQDVESVLPGSLQTWCLQSWKKSEIQYWRPSPSDRDKCSFESVAKECRNVLESSVSQCIRTIERPVFALSGGLDSTSLFLIGKNQKRDVRTASVVVDDPALNERDLQMSALSRNTDNHIEVKLDETVFSDFFMRLTDHAPLPVTPTVVGRMQLYKTLQERGVDSIVEGWGNDQILGGYHVHTKVFFESLILTGQWRVFLREYNSLLSRYQATKEVGQISKEEILLGALKRNGIAERVKNTLAHRWQLRYRNHPMLTKSFRDYYSSDIFFRARIFRDLPYFARFLATSVFITGLPFGLRSAGFASTMFGVQSLFPYLDRKYVDFCFSLPSEWMFRNGFSKYILREAMVNVVPNDIRLKDYKRGLEIPIEKWMRQSKVEKRVLSILACKSNFINRSSFEGLVKEFYSGSRTDEQTANMIWRACMIVAIEARLN